MRRWIAPGLLAVNLGALAASQVHLHARDDALRHSIEQTQKALAIAGDWEKIAKDWRTAANLALKVAAENRDEFLVCNSMLPAGRRLR